MIDAIQLKEFLQAQVGSQLGTYRFSGGMQATAIAILPDAELGYNYPPEGTVTSGVEIKIFRPLNKIIPLIGNIPMTPAPWKVLLLQWNNNGSLVDLANQLVPAISMQFDCEMGTSVIIPANPSKGIVEQCLIRFLEYRIEA